MPSSSPLTNHKRKNPTINSIQIHLQKEKIITKNHINCPNSYLLYSKLKKIHKTYSFRVYREKKEKLTKRTKMPSEKRFRKLHFICTIPRHVRLAGGSHSHSHRVQPEPFPRPAYVSWPIFIG